MRKHVGPPEGMNSGALGSDPGAYGPSGILRDDVFEYVRDAEAGNRGPEETTDILMELFEQHASKRLTDQVVGEAEWPDFDHPQRVRDRKELVGGWYWVRENSEDLYLAAEWQLARFDDGGDSFWFPGTERGLGFEDLIEAVLAFEYESLKAWKIPGYALRTAQHRQTPAVEVARETVSKAYTTGSNDFAVEHQNDGLTQGEMHMGRHDAGINAVMTLLASKGGQ